MPIVTSTATGHAPAFSAPFTRVTETMTANKFANNKSTPESFSSCGYCLHAIGTALAIASGLPNLASAVSLYLHHLLGQSIDPTCPLKGIRLNARGYKPAHAIHDLDFVRTADIRAVSALPQKDKPLQKNAPSLFANW